MTIHDVMHSALKQLDTGNLSPMINLVDSLRYRGYKYDDISRLYCQLTGLDSQDFDQLMDLLDTEGDK